MKVNEVIDYSAIALTKNELKENNMNITNKCGGRGCSLPGKGWK